MTRRTQPTALRAVLFPVAPAYMGGSGGGCIGPPSAGGTSSRKNAAPSTPPRVEKIPPAHSRSKKLNAYPSGLEVPKDSSAARIRGHVASYAEQFTRDALPNRGEYDVQCERDNEPHECPDHSSHESGEGAAASRDRTLVVLLIEVRREHTATHDPKAAAVAPTDDWQCRQDPDEQSAEKRRLQHGVTLAACRATGYGRTSRNIRAPSG
jgi:hypothetical protein